jgi:SAM-dependent MidA family methyltransferase
MNAKQHTSLPVPDAESLARSATLSARIAAEIAGAGGWIPFSRFMELALYTPGLGYYGGANVKFGRTGADGSDFITAPELSPFFGRALAQPVAEALALAGADEIIEFGAGTGKLAVELMLALDALDADQPVDAISRARRPATAVRRCQRYTIIELSGELRARQKATIAARAPDLLTRVQWLDRLPDRFTGVVIGNEVLDAMPIQLHAYTDGQWHERGVSLDGSHIVWQDRRVAEAPAVPPATLRAIGSTGADYLLETHVAARAFITTVCAMLERGAAIFIDYGFPAHEYYHPQRTGGTLMCHYRHHAHQDPLLYPGLQDITAHVDFSGLAEAAMETGADVIGYMSQARFLLNAGIADHLSRAVSPNDPLHYLPAANGVQKLLSEAEMGELFKVIGFARGLEDAPQAFIAGDRSWTLLPDDEEEAKDEEANRGADEASSGNTQRASHDTQQDDTPRQAPRS